MKKIYFAAFLLAPAGAWANSMPINFIPPQVAAWIFRIIGISGILLSAALGFAGLKIAAKKNLDSTAKVFARGFLGVSAVICFAVSAAFVAFSFSDISWVAKLAASLAILFLAAEFGIAGSLYSRVHAGKGGGWAKALSLFSYILCALLGVAAITVFGSMFPGVPAAETIFFCGALSLIVMSAYRVVKNGLPGTPSEAGKIWLIGMGAFILALMGAYMISSGMAQSVQNLVFTATCLFLGAVTVFEGWLLWRLTGRNAARAIGVVCFILGGAICIVCLLALA